MKITELPQPAGAVTSLALDASLEHVYIGTSDGHNHSCRNVRDAATGDEGVRMRRRHPLRRSPCWDFSAVIGVWWSWRLTGPCPRGVGSTRRRAVRLDPHSDAYVPFPLRAGDVVCPSQRVKGFVTGDAGQCLPASCHLFSNLVEARHWRVSDSCGGICAERRRRDRSGWSRTAVGLPGPEPRILRSHWTHSSAKSGTRV